MPLSEERMAKLNKDVSEELEALLEQLSKNPPAPERYNVRAALALIQKAHGKDH